jgi:uncharacterized protein (TIGR02284 family)
MIDNTTLLHRLTSLFHLDVDATRAYQQAIDNTDHPPVVNQLRSFQADHERHIADLGALIRKFGGEVPDRKPGIKGFILGGFTAIRSQTGTIGALKAMEVNENLANRTYKGVLDLDLPADARVVIERNYQDELRHIDWIRQAVIRRSWEQPQPPAP